MREMTRPEFEAYEKRVEAVLSGVETSIEPWEEKDFEEVATAARDVVNIRREYLEHTEQQATADGREAGTVLSDNERLGSSRRDAWRSRGRARQRYDDRGRCGSAIDRPRRGKWARSIICARRLQARNRERCSLGRCWKHMAPGSCRSRSRSAKGDRRQGKIQSTARPQCSRAARR